MNKLSIIELPLNGLKLIERHLAIDSRGSFSRLFCSEELLQACWEKPIVQINHTITTKQGTVRGMHYQRSPNLEMKLITCIQGEVFDVAVDLRSNSPTFLHCHAEILSSRNNSAILIPEGFAHGFQSLTDDVQLIYCHSAPYNLSSEGGLNPLDSCLNIKWPLAISEISIKDAKHQLIDFNFKGVKF